MDRTLRYKRVTAVCSVVAVAALFTWLTVFLWNRFAVFGDDPETFKAFIEGYGWRSRLVALGIQIAQVVISLIPGEVVEVGIGYTFGAMEGTLLCLGGVGAASALIFLLVKRLGLRLVELFVPREKIDSLWFIRSETRLKRLVFLLYFIPGTPKDILTYFVGLTRLKLHEFLIITLLARIPSVVSSTIGGNLIQQENYLSAIVVFAITGAVSLAGMVLYNAICKRRKKA